MSSAPTGTLLSSVKKQFELLAEQSERDLVLILFEPGPRVSLKDALLMCPFSRDHCPDGPPDAQSIVRLRRIDERTIQEFIFASPHAGKTRGEFLKLAKEAGNCLGDWAKESGVADAVLAEKGPAVRWMKLLFSFALERSDFPARGKWYCLNLPDQSSGRYAVISDAIRCSLYAFDRLNGAKATDLIAVLQKLDQLQDGMSVLQDRESRTADSMAELRFASTVKGVSLRDIAGAMCEGNAAAIRETKKRWHNSRDPKLPPCLGTAPEDKRTYLYELSAILKFVRNVECLSKPDISALNASLRKRLRPVIPPETS